MRPQKTVPSFTAAIALTTVIALAAVAVPVFLLRPRPAPVRHATISVTAGPVEVIPPRSTPVRRALVAEVESFLTKLYQRAFITSQVEPGQTAAPMATAIEASFTPSARASLRAHPEIFDARGFALDRGRITFDGLINAEGGVAQAYLNVAFDANGRTDDWPVELHHAGRLLLARTGEVWSVSGFDLRLRQVPVTPSPSPDHGTRS